MDRADTPRGGRGADGRRDRARAPVAVGGSRARRRRGVRARREAWSQVASAASRTLRGKARRRCSSSPATSKSSPPRSCRVLSDRALAEGLGGAAHLRYRSWHTTPAEYAARVHSLVDASLHVGGVAGERPRVLLVTAAGERDDANGRRARALREEIDSARARDRWRGSAARRLFFYVAQPFRVRTCGASDRPAAVVAESPYLGFVVFVALSSLRRGRPSVIVETHEDWRAATRHSGSRGRVLLAPLADRMARYTLRRADALRALSPYTAGLAGREAGVPPLESFPAYFDLSAFGERPPQPLPKTPTVLFVGMLERTKGVATLAAAWPRVVGRVPEARLVIVGRGAPGTWSTGSGTTPRGR